jgi:hypothetical protein
MVVWFWSLERVGTQRWEIMARFCIFSHFKYEKESVIKVIKVTTILPFEITSLPLGD